MSAKLYYSPFIPAFSSNGAPMPGAQLLFYLTGTTTKTTIYSDAGLSVPLANPVVADSAGRFSAIYLNDAVTYRVRQLDASGAQIGSDIDPYVPGTALLGPTGPTGPTGDVTPAATAAATAAAASATAAAISAASAAGFATGLFPDTASGITATTSTTNKYFLVVGSGSTYATLYKNVSGTATNQNVAIPSLAAMQLAPAAISDRFGKLNVFDLNAITPATVIANGGAVSSDANYAATDYMPVIPGTMTFSQLLNASGAGFAVQFYDIAKTWIANSGAVTAGTPVTVPANTAYARATLQIIGGVPNNLNTLMVVQGSVLPSAYQQFGVLSISRALTDARSMANAAKDARTSLFQPSLLTAGNAINPDGSLSTNSGFFVTNYMPVTGGGTFTTTPGFPEFAGTGSTYQVVYYDGEKNWIGSGSPYGAPLTANYVHTVPAGAFFARMTVRNDHLMTFAAVEGSTTIVSQASRTPALLSDVRQWGGKQFAILGDSISANQDWLSTVAGELGATNALYAALSGRSMVNALKDAAGANLTSSSFTSIDLTILFLGVNDWGGNIVLGTISDSTAGTTFYALTKKAIEQMITWKPTMKILVSTLLPRFNYSGTTITGSNNTLTNTNGNTPADFAAALRTIANYYSLPILDWERISGLNPINALGMYLNESGTLLHSNSTGYSFSLIPAAHGVLSSLYPSEV